MSNEEIKIKPAYYAIIPASVRYSNIPANAKLLYGEITALSNKEGFCWASNPYFAQLYEADSSSITRWVGALVKAGFIRIEVDKAAGNLRKIWLTEPTPTRKIEGSYPQKSGEDYLQKRGHSNTSVNTKNNNFVEFWNLYPKKVEKKKAEAKWARLTKATQDLVLTDLPKRLLTEQWQKNNGQFVPNPMTYLNGERWNDQIVQPASIVQYTQQREQEKLKLKQMEAERAPINSEGRKKFDALKDKFKMKTI